MPEPEQVVVIGAGISGLACAYRLEQLGVQPLLLESASRVGGLVGTIERDGFLFESGPQSFQGTESILELIRRLGIEPELLKADPRAPRFVLQHGKLQKIPMSPQAMLTSSLLSATSRWKVVSEPFRRTRPPTEEESVANFVRRKFGHEILEYLVAPFVSGVYAGDPERLSLKAAFPTLDEWEREHGSVLRGAMKSRSGERPTSPPLCSFLHGVGTLTDAMSKKLGDKVQTGVQVLSLKRSGQTDGASYEIRVSRLGREDTIRASAVVIATPSFRAGEMITSISSRLGATLSGIAYAPVVVVASAYYRQQVGNPLEGFGYLVPRSEKLRTLGTVWNSSLFAGRAHQGMVTMTSFIGGATDLGILEKSEDEIATIVHGENARILQITGRPVASIVWRHAKALPQYNMGHGHIVDSIRDEEREIPGLFFAGNYLEGPSLGKCVEQGSQTAESVKNYLHP